VGVTINYAENKRGVIQF